MKKLRQLEAKFFANLVCEANEMTKGERAALGVGSGAVAMTVLAASAIAAPRFDQAIGNMLQRVYGYILGVSTGLAVVLAAWNIIKYMAATDPQSALMAKKAAIRVGLAWVVLNSLGGIAVLGSELAKGGQYTGGWHS